ncbi:peptidylprolyl isomerase [Chloroflexota bacterium]
MARKQTEKPRREITHHQLSQSQKQKKLQRIVSTAGIVVVVVIIAIMGVGWYVGYYQPLQETVIRVNTTEFDMGYYVKMLGLYGKEWPIQYADSLSDGVVGVIQRNELIRQGALDAGIAVSADEISEKLASYEPPLSKDYQDIARTDLLVDKLMERHFEPMIPQVAEHRNVMAIFLESEEQALEMRARIEAGEDFTILAEEYSLDAESRENKGELGWHPEDVLDWQLSPVLGESAFSAEIGELSLPVYDEEKNKNTGYWLVEVLTRIEETKQAQMRAILLSSEAEAEVVKARLDAGEDFADLAEEVSLHEETKGSGGDFDWLDPADVLPGADYAAWADIFEAEVGTLSEPIHDVDQVTSGGYWLLKVLAVEENRQMSEGDLELLTTQAFDVWLLTLWSEAESDLKNYMTEEDRDWAVERALGG